jgi:C4-dicarboxylate-specific signal transduction histidine kinase
MEVAAAMLRKGHGNEPLACCFARDLTERKRMEKELIKSDRLATIGKMAAGVAHEVNNPLGIISAHTEDLVSGELTPREASESLEIIRRNALRAGRIIEALLGQALPRSPRMTELDLGEIIDGCLTFLRPRMKKIKVETEIAPGLYWIRGDESQMQQVFVNLLLNSAESLSKGGLIKVWIQNGFPSKTENHQVWIEDNGSGIESAEREKIFDPFYTKNKAKGVGLGLFVSERIVSRHGGTIRAAESSLGGAAMVVSLPALVGGRL